MEGDPGAKGEFLSENLRNFQDALRNQNSDLNIVANRISKEAPDRCQLMAKSPILLLLAYSPHAQAQNGGA